MEIAVENIYFQKRQEHIVTNKSGSSSTQIDYILCRRGNFRVFRDCKVVAGDSLAKRHQMVVCKIMMKMGKIRSMKTEQRWSSGS